VSRHLREPHGVATATALRIQAQGASVHRVRPPAGEAFDAGRQALAELLASTGGTVTAAAFANDHLACGALLEAQARRIDVPRQVALIGFGDFAISRQLQAALSSVSPPRYEIGVEAARALLSTIGSGQAPAHRALKWGMIFRANTLAAG
jgi:LacI family transcriptional regulator, gluconate utilization system Gnt-I transcriptional repressor